MYISHETSEETQARLGSVLAESQFVVHPGPYAFVEDSVASFPHERVHDAVAFVRDDEVWSALVPSTNPADERFLLFSFHFPPGLDNSGFVGWLASHLKSTVGTGVLVVCGQNTNRGGIFDYWGAPLAVAEGVIHEVDRLRADGNHRETTSL